MFKEPGQNSQSPVFMRLSVHKTRIPSVNDVIPGALVLHHLTPEIGIVLRVNWEMVELLSCNGSVVRWELDSFRSTYEIPL